jgi:predicted MarR family transcription regulator
MGSERPKRQDHARPSAAGRGAAAPSRRGNEVGPIVSSSHLAAGVLPGLSEVEFGLSLAVHAFHRWMVRCMAAAGVPDLSPLEVLVLHSVRHRQRPKKLADLCLVLGIEDAHVIAYAVKKLVAAGLLTSTKAGKEKLIAASNTGVEACDRYHSVRERLLALPVKATGLPDPTLSELGSLLRALSGHYDQAARAAASL